ncbi:MAG: hypothetical protein LBQ41_03585 [Candidatus Ancillula sp.]|jgi:O-antigen/teichoic acid export membrane protein|nr:hypothetical protein [Candidatus Ancillula sp.]
MQKQDLKKDYLWNTAATFLQACISLFLLIWVTRFNGTAHSALFSSAYGYSITLGAIALFGGRNYQVTDSRGEFKTYEYIWARGFICILTLFIAIAFAFFGGFDLEKSLVIISFTVFQVIVSLSEVLFGIMQRHHILYKAGQSNFAKVAIGMVLFAAVDFVTGSIFYSSLTLIVVALVFLVFIDIPLTRGVEKVQFGAFSVGEFCKESVRVLSKMFLVALTIVLLGLFANIGRFFIDLYHPDEQAVWGILILPASFIFVLVQTIVSPLLKPLSDHFQAESFREFQKVVQKVQYITLGIGLVIVVLTYFLGVPVLSLVFGLDLTGFEWQLTVTIFGSVFFSLCGAYYNVLTTMRIVNQQVFLVGIPLLLHILIAAVGVNLYGMPGAVAAYIGSNIIQAVSCYLVYNHKLRKLVQGKGSATNSG